jgi:hypothetical protein
LTALRSTLAGLDFAFASTETNFDGSERQQHMLAAMAKAGNAADAVRSNTTSSCAREIAVYIPGYLNVLSAAPFIDAGVHRKLHATFHEKTNRKLNLCEEE